MAEYGNGKKKFKIGGDIIWADDRRQAVQMYNYVNADRNQQIIQDNGGDILPGMADPTPEPMPMDPGDPGDGSGSGIPQITEASLPKPPSTPEEIDAYIRTNYPQMAWALNHPEIGPILRQAAREMWSAGRFQGALLNTEWYKTTTVNQREWDALFAADPATARERFDEMWHKIGEMAQQLGIPLDMADWGLGFQIAAQAVRSGWSDERIVDELIGKAEAATLGNGTLTGTADALMAKARGDWFIPLSRDAALDWAKRILAGTADEAGFESYLKDLAKGGQNQAVADKIDAGYTLKQISDPYVQQVASLMELNPAAVDMTDPRWSKFLNYYDPDTKTYRMMTMSEAATAIRSDPGWAKTGQALDQAARTGQELLQLFGKVA